jgi:pilus assembly protein Flp/PilA
MRLIIKFLKDESGATAIEYSLIAAGISLAVIAVVNVLVQRSTTAFPQSRRS